jgi:hypothetical protein
MKEFKAGSVGLGAAAYIRVVVGGKISSGKTSFAATAPYPLFFADLREGGFKTLRTMSKNPRRRAFWWDPNFEPGVWAMESMLDYKPAIAKLRTLISSKQCPYQTLVVDSLSVYGQRVLSELKDKDPSGDNRQRYGSLNDAVSWLVSEIHTLPLHVVWLCHINDEYQLAVPGKSTAAVWALMDHKWLIRADVKPNAKTDYQLHTRPFRTATWIGGRGEELPDPMIPSFKCVLPLLGFDGKPISPSVPDYMGIAYPDGAVYTLPPE